MAIVTSKRYYDHAVYVISQFAPSVLKDIDYENNIDKNDRAFNKALSEDNSIIDVEIIDDT